MMSDKKKKWPDIQKSKHTYKELGIYSSYDDTSIKWNQTKTDTVGILVHRTLKLVITVFQKFKKLNWECERMKKYANWTSR